MILVRGFSLFRAADKRHVVVCRSIVIWVVRLSAPKVVPRRYGYVDGT